MREEIVEKISILITGAFGLVAALAWNNAIQAIFARYYKSGEGITSQVIYAVSVTIIAVLVTMWIGRVSKRAKEREELLKKHAEMITKQIRRITPVKPKRRI